MTKNISASERRIPFSRRRIAHLVGAALLGLAVTSCAVVPKPTTVDERKARAAKDLGTLFADQEPITGPIALADATARALKYNYDQRIKMMEIAMEQANLGVAGIAMLPSLTASAGYSWRDNINASSSTSVRTGRQSLEPSTSEEREITTAGAVIAWNVLDFGVSYVRAQQAANQVLVAEERKRKVMQNIVRDVRSTYWRAAAAQELLPQADALFQRVSEALERTRGMEQQKLMPANQALAYQRALLDISQLIMARRQELVSAQQELAALINARPDQPMQLAVGGDLPRLPSVPTEIDKLEQAALLNRPELGEEDYRREISVLETRRALLSLLPGLDLAAGPHYSSNRFLYNQGWSGVGMNISWNLFRLFNAPTILRQAESLKDVDDARRTAMSMAVLVQTRIAVQRYQENLTELALAEKGHDVDRRVFEVASAGVKARAEHELELLRAEARMLLSRMQRSVAYANAQSGYARILHSAGLEELTTSAAGMDLKILVGLVEKQQGKTVADLLVVEHAPAPEAAPVAESREAAPPTPPTLAAVIPAEAAALRPATDLTPERRFEAAVERPTSDDAEGATRTGEAPAPQDNKLSFLEWLFAQRPAEPEAPITTYQAVQAADGEVTGLVTRSWEEPAKPETKIAQ